MTKQDQIKELAQIITTELFSTESAIRFGWLAEEWATKLIEKGYVRKEDQ